MSRQELRSDNIPTNKRSHLWRAQHVRMEERRHIRWLLRTVAAMVWLLPGGCGESVYQSRLVRTERYVTYSREQNEHLALPAWYKDGMEFRVPKQFRLLPDSAIGDIPPPDAKSLLPEPLRSLEGLEAAWHAEIAVADGRQSAYVLVASNRHLWERGTTSFEESQRFEVRIAAAIHLLAGEVAPKKSDWKDVEFAQADGMSAPKRFQPFHTAPFTLPDHSHPLRIRAYVHVQDSLQVAVMFVLPDSVSANEKLTESQRIGMSLQTLNTDTVALPRR